MKFIVRTCLALVLGLWLPTVAQAQFTFTTNNGAITITGYTGTDGVMNIPNSTNGLPVTTIGSYAFSHYGTITNATIPAKP